MENNVINLRETAEKFHKIPVKKVILCSTFCFREPKSERSMIRTEPERNKEDFKSVLRIEHNYRSLSGNSNCVRTTHWGMPPSASEP